MDPGATRAGSVLCVGTGTELVREAVADVLSAATAVTIPEGVDDEAVERAARSIDRADRLVEDPAAVNTFSVKSRGISESLTDGDADEP